MYDTNVFISKIISISSWKWKFPTIAISDHLKKNIITEIYIVIINEIRALAKHTNVR